MTGIPKFIDVEASSFADHSYPIEIAWNDGHHDIQSYLIDPTSVTSWNDWSLASEQIHGLARETLKREGSPANSVSEALKKELTGKIVYSDNPDFDGMWICNLFDGVGKTLPEFSLEHVDSLVLPILMKKHDSGLIALNQLARFKLRARRCVRGRHRAGVDVQFLVKLWQLVTES